MAGDWLKMTHDLAEKPEVVGMSSTLRIDCFSVVGRLHRVWTWFDKHTEDGCATGVTPAFFDSLVAHEGFAAAMIAVGWMSSRNGRIALPNFDRHISKSAKSRDLAAERMKRSRYGAGATKPSPEQRPEPEKDLSGNQNAGPPPKPHRGTTPRSSGASRKRGLVLSLEVLRDVVLFDQWCRGEMTHPKGFIKTDDDRSFAMSARDKALTDSTVTNPVGWFKDTVRLKRYDRVPQSHDGAGDHSKPVGPLDQDAAALVRRIADKRRAM